MYKNNKSGLLTEGKRKVTDKFHQEICRTQGKKNTYSEAYRRKISFETSKSNISGLLNRSIQRNRSIDRSRDGSVERSQYKTLNMDISSNILNISIHSNSSN